MRSRTTPDHLLLCDFCGMSSLMLNTAAFPGLVVGGHGACICGSCAKEAAAKCEKQGGTQMAQEVAAARCAAAKAMDAAESHGAMFKAGNQAYRQMVAAQRAMADLSLAGPRAPRPISITDLDDRIVIEVGRTELRLTREEAARLFARGRDFGSKPQA
jgi:hypothetical protein